MNMRSLLMKYDLIRVASCSPVVHLADPAANTQEIMKLMQVDTRTDICLYVFPELSLTGYTCQDLFYQPTLLEGALKALETLLNETQHIESLIVVGLPLSFKNSLYNCAAVLFRGQVLGFVPKSYLPTTNEFYEKRWFTSGFSLINETYRWNGQSIPFGTDLIFSHTDYPAFKLGIEICEDLWAPLPPSTGLAIQGATVIANLSASNDLVGKISYRQELIRQQSARTLTGYLYASSGFGESTTDLVFGGHCLICENGQTLAENKRFQLNGSVISAEIDLGKILFDRTKSSSVSDSSQFYPLNPYRTIYFDCVLKEITFSRVLDAHPFVPSNIEKRHERCDEIFQIQTIGLAKRLSHIRCQDVVIGISGGLDSTLAFLVCVKTFDLLGLSRHNIHAVTMPGFGTTDRTYQNAVSLIEHLGAHFMEIPIGKATMLHFEDIGHDPSLHDITYENSQARERTQILMDLSNQLNGIVIGTGDLSELALGWATYNGDHMSMYGVNGSIPKSLVRYLVEWVATTQVSEDAKEVLLDILDTPVSPELLPPDADGNIQQKTEEVVGPYELHDFFLYHMIRFGFPPLKILYYAEVAFIGTYDRPYILKWLKTFYRRFFTQQFKRSCLPDGPKVGSICLSPRGDWRMPSDAMFSLWMKELED